MPWRIVAQHAWVTHYRSCQEQKDREELENMMMKPLPLLPFAPKPKSRSGWTVKPWTKGETGKLAAHG